MNSSYLTNFNTLQYLIMEEYNAVFGNVFNYPLNKVYCNTLNILKWKPIKVINLFDDMIEVYEDDLTLIDNEYDRYIIHNRITMIKKYISCMEGLMV